MYTFLYTIKDVIVSIVFRAKRISFVLMLILLQLIMKTSSLFAIDLVFSF